MLIESLAEMAFNAGAERVSLEIHPKTQDSGSVVVLTSFGVGSTPKADEKGENILAVLSQPMMLSGAFGDMDQRVVGLVDEVRDDVVSASDSLPQTDAKTMRDKLKEAAKPKVKSKVKSDTPSSAEASTEAVETTNDAETTADAFVSGEAGSL